MKANGNLHVNQQSNNDSTKAATELADAPFSDHAWRATAIDRKAPQDWNCDSACTSHMSPNHNDFTTIMPFDYNHQVIFGDGRSVIAKGRGDVMIQLPGNKAGTKHRTNNVLFVPELATNLLSIFQLESRGFVVTFANGKVTFAHSGSIKVYAKRIGRDYILHSTVTSDSALLTIEKPITEKTDK